MTKATWGCAQGTGKFRAASVRMPPKASGQAPARPKRLRPVRPMRVMDLKIIEH
ncbi:hypothetical protein [Deinococcus multiflagellatus]|uniref:Uncharacterized protein n=1 Tax=Deinococcus multiflagellatus TaxID=1656887 RepID=A0ABW1ZRS2_9DEIO